MNFAPLLQRNEHKGQNGVVTVVAGGRYYHGAAYFAAMAALRSGVDLVYLFVPSCIVNRIATPECIVVPYEEEILTPQVLTKLYPYVKKSDACVIGPGLGKEEATFRAVDLVLDNTMLPLVVDAEALPVLPHSDRQNLIATPHYGELQKLGIEDVKSWASQERVMLLKGVRDIITDGHRYVENTTGHPSMTKGGTGDVLAGLTAGFLAQSLDLFNSAYHAAYINGKVGEALAEKQGSFWLTSEMLPEISRQLHLATQ